MVVVVPASVVVVPILVVISNEEVVDLIFSPILPAVVDDVDHYFIEGGGAKSSSKVDMAPKPKNRAIALSPMKCKATAAPLVKL